MASMTIAAVTIPSFTGLKASKVGVVAKATPTLAAPKCSGVKASLKDVGIAVAATAASAMLVGNAMAKEMKVLLGSDDGGLVFVPSTFSVDSGDNIVFFNNAGFPHNVIFDEDDVPPGVNAGDISMPEDELLNSKGETYEVTLTTKGDYGFFCYPHRGAGMDGRLTVK